MRMRSRSKKWKSFCSLWCTFQLIILVQSEGESRQEGAKGAIFPRMDYNQWKPLGHGDPLKDDPTFDYVPPVLDHVHYWEETTEEGDPKMAINQTIFEKLGNTENKTEILLLGVSSKKPAVEIADKRKDKFEHFQAFAENNAHFDSNTYTHDEYNSKFYENKRIARPSFFPSISSADLPSLMSFQNKIFDKAAHSKDNALREPYTMLVPPPIEGDSNEAAHLLHLAHAAATPPVKPQRPLFFAASTGSGHENNYITSTPSVTIEESNLIYHSSSLSNPSEFESSGVYLSSVPSVHWQIPSSTNNYFDFNSRGQKQSSNSLALNKPNLTLNQQKLIAPDFKMRVKFSHPINSNSKLLEEAGSDNSVNYVTTPPIHKINMVTPPPLPNLNKPLLFKAHVSDDHAISNTYVKIEKPQAQMHSTGVGVNKVPIPIISSIGRDMYPDIITDPQVNMQTIRGMQTMQPPAPLRGFLTQNPIFIEADKPLLSIVEKEIASHNLNDAQKANYIASESKIINTATSSPSTVSFESNTQTSISTLNKTTTEAFDSTTSKTLTTDPLFKHYKQPLEPIKEGPLYLIIQGHSKVKTYKPAKQINGIMIQETNEIPKSDTRYKLVDFGVKHLHHIFQTVPGELSEREARSRSYGNLQTLKQIAQTGYGKISIESELFTEPTIRTTSEMIQSVLSTMQPENYNIHYNLNRMIEEVKGVPENSFDALNDLRNGKKDSNNVAATKSMDALDTATNENGYSLDEQKNENAFNNDIKETQISSKFEVGNVEDTSSERYHKGIVEAARRLKL